MNAVDRGDATCESDVAQVARMGSRFLNETFWGKFILSETATGDFDMATLRKNHLIDLLLENIPRSLLVGMRDGLELAARRALLTNRKMSDGHKASAVGLSRHFEMQEAFHGILQNEGASPNRLSGTSIVVGTTGVVRIARINVTNNNWERWRGSAFRKVLVEQNAAAARMLQGDLFSPVIPVESIAVFIVSRFSRQTTMSQESDGSPDAIYLAVPNPQKNRWLFRERLHAFIERYDRVPATQQPDLAKPRLKDKVKTGSTP